MRALLKVMLPLFVFFTSMLVLLRVTGLVTQEKIELWIAAARDVSPLWAATAVALLLFADLFVAVPTLSLMLVAGALLGFPVAAAASLIGLYAAGLGGYALSRQFGEPLVRRIVKDDAQRAEMSAAFREHGVVMILLSRALPMLPEMSACLAGLTKMRLGRFVLAWTGSTVPYVLVATFAGSQSSLDNPWPAIAAAVGLAGFFGVCWWLFQRSLKTRNADAAPVR
jgi:uncharacterized membrane protein YdjX (TVP38/TMEM64 family)